MRALLFHGKQLLAALYNRVTLARRSLESRAICHSNPAAPVRDETSALQGWYAGDAARMERALHPELAKRIVRTDANGNFRLDQQSAMTLVQGTRNGGGTKTPQANRRDEVRILDIFRNAASVRVDASDWVDYLHIAKWRGRWVIVNVLWELMPR